VRAGIGNNGPKIPLIVDNSGVHGGAIRCTSANGNGPATLPGVLDHAEFSRVSTDLGRCTGCGEGRAVFRSSDGRTLLCERCYARVVKEWNEGKGIA